MRRSICRFAGLLALKFLQGLLSWRQDFLNHGSYWFWRELPVDKAETRFSAAFSLEKLDESKNCGNHRGASENGELGQEDHTTMAGDLNTVQLCGPIPAIMVKQALKIIPLGDCG